MALNRKSGLGIQESSRDPPSLFEGGAPQRLYEEHAYVLDYLQHGRPSAERPRHLALPTVQMIGENYFTLLEAEIRIGVQVNLHDRLYIGREKREKVSRILGRIKYNDLTANAKAELMPLLEELIANQEPRFVAFFNTSQPITPRMHALELLPGVGKKSMWHIINEREKKPFESFADIEGRTGISVPVKIVAKRILDELTGGEKYRVFSRSY